MIDISPTTQQPAEFHIGEELTAEQRENFRSSLYDDFPELLKPLDSPLDSPRRSVVLFCSGNTKARSTGSDFGCRQQCQHFRT
jgi:hypothetical protein